MALEIERKFLVIDDGWRALAHSNVHIVDYLIARFDTGKARIRVCDGAATLTIKGQRKKFTRSEFHMPVAPDEASAMIDEFAIGRGLEKRRYEVRTGELTWQVDEYLGRLAGLVMADIELPSESHAFHRPSWIGPEITADHRYSSSVLAKAVQGENAAAQVALLVRAGG